VVTSIEEKPNPRGLYFGWSIGTLGVAILLNTQNALALFFFVPVLHIEPWLAGVIITASKIYDVVTDPLMGTLTDRTRSRWGRRRPYLFGGGIACGIAFALLFAVPEFGSEMSTVIYVAGALLVMATAYTVFNVPYLAMPAEIVEGYHERSQLMSYRVVFIAIGTFIATAGTPAIIGFLENYLGYDARQTYAILGAGYGVLITAAMVASFYGTRGASFTEHVDAKMPIAERIRLVFNNRPFLLFLMIKLTGLFTLAAGLAAKFFFVTVVMQQNIEIAGIFGLASLAGQMATLPLWLAYAKRHGKRRILWVSAILSGAIALSWLLSGPDESLWLYGLRGLALGMASCGTMLGTQAILPDVIEYDYRLTGLRREGIFAGMTSFMEKLAFTLSAFIVGGFLSFMDFDSNLPPDQQPESAILAVLFLQALLPAGLVLFQLLLLYFYDLDEEKLKSTVPPTVPAA
jgi:GPH family glycoside/pentoside/hexuronide:cation symporter